MKTAFEKYNKMIASVLYNILIEVDMEMEASNRK